MSFGRDGEHSLDRLGVFGMAQCGVAEQRVDRGEPGVAGGHAVAAIGFQMGEERGDELCVEVADVEPGRCFAGVLLREDEQQSQCVAVGGDGVRAGVTLGGQPLGEEHLDRGRQRGHGRAPLCCSSRRAATANSSGVACRYQ